nr:TIGR03089 family protein [Dermatophilus congolensis]
MTFVFDTHCFLNTLTTDPTTPRITRYDSWGRIELSGRVLGNWVAKATNLLRTEYDPQPLDVIALDLPAGHWRTLYWALATWACGAHLHIIDPETDLATVTTSTGSPLLAITDRPTKWTHLPLDTIAVSTAPLARSFDSDLAGALDEAAEISSYPDSADLATIADPHDPACSDHGYEVTYNDLISPHSPERLLLPLSADTSRMQALTLITSVLAAGGSIVTSDTTEDLNRLATIERANLHHL